MAHIECSFYSSALKKNTKCIVFIPTGSPDDYFKGRSKEYFTSQEYYQTVYLLHGAYSCCSDLTLLSNIELYAQSRNFAVVIPSVENSIYQNIEGMSAYSTYCVNELPDFLCTIFPLARERENRFVIGLFEGGYGALALSFENPGLFSQCAVISGCINFSGLLNGAKGYVSKLPANYKRLLSDRQFVKKNPDLEYKLSQSQDLIHSLPRYYFSSGLEDPFYEETMAYADELHAKGCSVNKVSIKGKRNWAFWNEHIEDVLDWLQLKERCCS